MSSFIQTNYGGRVYDVPVKIGESKQPQTAAGSFLDMVSQVGTKWSDMQASTWSSIEGTETTAVQRRANLTVQRKVELLTQGVEQPEVESTYAVNAPSLEQMLKAKRMSYTFYFF